MHPCRGRSLDRPLPAPKQICKIADKVVRAGRAQRADLALFREKQAGMTLAPERPRVAGLITAGRRECWGSQTSGAGGHRNDAVPFCFVRAKKGPYPFFAGPHRKRGTAPFSTA